MIPNNGIAMIYTKIMGNHSLLSIAQSNLISNFERVSRTRTHTYFAFNGQTEFGVSHNYGEERYYSWEDTIIDCRNAPDLVGSDYIQDWGESLHENKRLRRLIDNLEIRMGGHISVTPFYSVLLGENNMKYNIKRRSKIDDFDIIRVGLRLKAENENMFKEGLLVLKEEDNPFKLKIKMSKNATKDNSNFQNSIN